MYKLRKYVRIAAGIVLVLLALSSYLGRENTAKIEQTYVESSIQAESRESSSHKNEDGENLHHWGNPNTLQDHFDRHGRDFGAKNQNDYARQANELFNNRDEYLVKVDDDGVLRIYDPDTNSFGAYNENGSTRSFFKPSDNRDYFDRQPGKLQK